MSALICGSIAYDNIMVFEDSFKNHILPEQIHILNVAFLVPELRREFGGCALNIAYNLKLLGEEPLPMGIAGKDFAPYRAWLERWEIRQDHLKVLDDVYTAQAFITTDLDDICLEVIGSSHGIKRIVNISIDYHKFMPYWKGRTRYMDCKS